MVCKALHSLLSPLPIVSLPFLLSHFALSLSGTLFPQFSAWFLFYIIQIPVQISPYQRRPFQTMLTSLSTFLYSVLFFSIALFTSDKLYIYLFFCLDWFNGLLSGLLTSTLALLPNEFLFQQVMFLKM